MAASWKATRHIALGGTSLVAALFLVAGPALAQSANASQGDAQAAEASEEEEIVVTGTSIRGVPPTGSNLISVTREDIETHGGANTPDLSASIPQLSSFNTAPQTSAGTGPGLGSFAPALRGLPASATLPLMNGHRLVGAGVQVTNPDYPLVPNLAVERIEVVADGSSAIYGSDAVAGVVNFITRRNFSGAEISASYGVADDYYAGQIGGVFGRDWGSGSILAAYQYTENDNITGGERDYRVLDYSPWGGVDARPSACAEPNVYVGAPYFDPAPSYAYDSTTDTFGAAGTRNRCDSAAGADIFPSSDIHALFVSAQQDLSDNARLWGEILYSDRRDDIQVAPPAAYVQMWCPGNVFFVPANPNARCPVGAQYEGVYFNVGNILGTDHFTNTNHKVVRNSSLGVDFDLPNDLNLRVYGTSDWADNDTFVPLVSPTALQAYASSTNPADALDPFGANTPQATIEALRDGTYFVDVTEEQSVNLAALKLDGPLADLPGGQLRFAAGAEARHEAFAQRGYYLSPAANVDEDMDRDVRAVYGELFIPLVGPANAAPFVRRLTLSLSDRYDDYSDFGSTNNPKLGVNWEPMDGLALRGSYGTSFRAPGLRNLGATIGSFYVYPADAGTTVNADVAGVQTVYLSGGNPNLEPEEATTYSFGFDLNPSSLRDLRASLTYYNIEYTNVIASPTFANIFADPTLESSLVYFGDVSDPEIDNLLNGIGAQPSGFPASPISGDIYVVDRRVQNLSTLTTDGLDFDVNYRWTTGFGAVFAGVAGNYILNYETRFSPQAAEANGLDLGLPRWTARASLAAQADTISLAGFINYRDGVTSTYATTAAPFIATYESDPYVTLDLRFAWTLPDAGMTEGTILALQVNDVFDEAPPFFPASSGSPYFDGIGGNYNPIGRYVGLNLRKAF